ncbi:Uncharacterised protein [Vibrio cholerae]|nr:Uncharacterised protein [Vibrio cholerae]CSI10368.1 Uncharacterised protein [Vibrio cholerae]CSI43639.1 Uncharacterised protein [Vibrio cholerae]
MAPAQILIILSIEVEAIASFLFGGMARRIRLCMHHLW